MVKFEEIGFGSFEEYISHFFKTLLPSNKTYEYFVDWRKVKKLLEKHAVEVSLLNSLTKINKRLREVHFKNLILEYPKVVEIIPMLIAERVKKGKIDIFDPEIEDFILFDFRISNVTNQTSSSIIDFCYKTGILELFENVKDLYDYLLGVEVGLDSNARKNRSGEIFERMVKQKVKELTKNKFEIKENDKNFSLYPAITSGKIKGKTHDIVIYQDGIPHFIIECNFYNVSGSKPVSIAESYIEMFQVAKRKNIEFIWITDGPAWHKMREPLLRSMKQMEWVLNFRMIKLLNKIFELVERIK